MRGAVLGEDVAGEMIAPGQQRHLQLELHGARVRGDDDVVGRAVLEGARRDDAKVLADVAEPEAGRVEKMRAEVGKHAGALVAPVGIADQPRRPVAVEHAAAIDAPECTRGEEVAHADIVRLEAMVVGGVADRAGLSRQRFQLLELGVALCRKRLLHEHMLAVSEQVSKDRDFRRVGGADERCIVTVERRLRAISRHAASGADRIDDADCIRTGNAQALFSLNSVADDDNPHGRHSSDAELQR